MTMLIYPFHLSTSVLVSQDLPDEKLLLPKQPATADRRQKGRRAKMIGATVRLRAILLFPDLLYLAFTPSLL